MFFSCLGSSDRYRRFFAVNVIFTVITQLIPVLYMGILFRVRHLLHPSSERSPQAQLRDRQKRERSDPRLKPIKMLFTHYDLGWWFFEIIELYRRILFISVLSLIPNKLIASVLGMLLAIASTYLYGIGSPYHQVESALQTKLHRL